MDHQSNLAQNARKLGFVAVNEGEAVRQLNAAVELIEDQGWTGKRRTPARRVLPPERIEPQGKVVALFPGQGSQYVDMGRELAVSFPPIRQAFAEMDEAFELDGMLPLSRMIFPIPAFDNAQKESQSNTLTQHRARPTCDRNVECRNV